MKSYWSTSAFADKVRGTKKLASGTATEWRQWEQSAKTAHPIRYWIAEEFLDYINEVWTYIPSKVNDISYYINNRWVSRTNSLTASKQDIKPGEWRDVGDRILYCLFNELQDFVEIEVAWNHITFSDPDTARLYNIPKNKTSRFSRRSFRCPQAGIDSLKWQSTIIQSAEEGYSGDEVGKLSRQAINAVEILELYNWWTTTYRSRPTPEDASGWSTVHQLVDDDFESVMDSLENLDKYPDLRKKSNDCLASMRTIEAKYMQEETDMLIRLIKIRDSLWT